MSGIGYSMEYLSGNSQSFVAIALQVALPPSSDLVSHNGSFGGKDTVPIPGALLASERWPLARVIESEVWLSNQSPKAIQGKRDGLLYSASTKPEFSQRFLQTVCICLTIHKSPFPCHLRSLKISSNSSGGEKSWSYLQSF
jgi:hypothetical protein